MSKDGEELLVRRSLATEIAAITLADASPHSPRVQRSLHMAASLLQRAQALQTHAEHRQQIELDRLIQNTNDKFILTLLTDQTFRSNDASRSAEQLIHILDVQGIPRFFSAVDRTLMRGFQSFGDWLPSVAMPLVKNKMREETANVVLPAGRTELANYLKERYQQSIHMNVNMLGEALLGERDAAERLDRYCDLLSWPEIECISVKISTIYSQIHGVNREQCIAILSERLERLYSAALQHYFVRADGTQVTKFVYLDMEEFRDLHMTAALFKRCLDKPSLQQLRAGIVLQAYIPDSFAVQQELTAWAAQRVAAGAAPITIRIVKGANLEMERVEASLAGLSLPCYPQKVLTDANYKRMLDYGLDVHHLQSVRLGIASHNLFDVAYAMVVAHESDAWSLIQFEMLEGMANHQRRAIQECQQNILLYAPACRQQEFTNAIGYLIRRLDENTGPDNFLRYSFNLKSDSDAYKRLEQTFIDSIAAQDALDCASYRRQNRNQPAQQPPACKHWWAYVNEPDTDFSLPHNSAWAAERAQNSQALLEQPIDVPLCVNGEERHGDQQQLWHAPNKPAQVLVRTTLASKKDMELAVAVAAADAAGWSQKQVHERRAILRTVAQEIRSNRGLLLETAMAEAGKTVVEIDLEINEAIDFIEFYAANAAYYEQIAGLAATPLGTVCVIPPWNFPLAIPCGGVAAALASGNRVILKPAPEACLCAYRLCQQFWAAGVSRQALQFVPCDEDEVGTALVQSEQVQAHVLTGASSTAQLFHRLNPQINLYAETGGKNAIIVTAMADRDLAIKNVIHSAFAHAGQKCSACSLLLLEDEIYNDEHFKAALCDAAQSLAHAPSWDLACKVNPLIHQAGDELSWALDNLEAGEDWALKPQQAADNAQLWSPGIKYNVARGSRSHLCEFFGPVLSVMPFSSLSDAIDVVNSSAYGLTSGLQSLDDREQDMWLARIQAGNLYINRPITGAAVLRQPFGGHGASSFGPGLKAGGPNYLSQFYRFSDTPEHDYDKMLHADDLHMFIDALADAVTEKQKKLLIHAADSYRYWAKQEFLQAHDQVRLIGQDNLRRYLPVDALRVRFTSEDELIDMCLCLLAARSVDVRCTMSIAADADPQVFEILHQASLAWGAGIECISESIEDLENAIAGGQCDRLRYLQKSSVAASLLALCPQHYCHIERRRPCVHGRIELLRYLREQSISFDYHRYGNLGKRGAEERSALMQPIAES